MSLPFQNLYVHRLVAEANAKSCFICYRPSTSVLVTPDQADFFYVCPGHLKDRGFATEKVKEKSVAEAEAERLRAEVEKVTKEWQEKEKRRKEAKEKEKEDNKDKDKDKDKDKGKDKKDGDKEGSSKDKDKDGDSKKEGEHKQPEKQAPSKKAPPEYILHKKVFDMRLQRVRRAQEAKRQIEMLRDLNTFPSVPKGNPV